MVLIEQLSFAYPGQPPLFDRLNLSLPAGNIYGLLGRNGAGKSTLLKIITGLLFPKSGNVTVLGFEPRHRHPQFLRDVYFITEEFHLPSINIEAYAQLYSAFYPRFNEVQFETYLQEFELVKSMRLSSLSYGQKKKFLLSFGLATDCKLLVMDEPTNGLDIPSKSQFRKIIASAIHEERSFIISTHQVRDMENLVDPVIVMDEGKIAFFENYESISQRLSVRNQKNFPDMSPVLYCENTLRGFTVVTENTGEIETNMNLEILFNAIIHNKEAIRSVFKKEIADHE